MDLRATRETEVLLDTLDTMLEERENQEKWDVKDIRDLKEQVLGLEWLQKDDKESTVSPPQDKEGKEEKEREVSQVYLARKDSEELLAHLEEREARELTVLDTSVTKDKREHLATLVVVGAKESQAIWVLEDFPVVRVKADSLD